jgi:hypothetical protein
MMFQFLILFLCLSIHCFAFLSKNVHLPPSSTDINSIGFSITRSLKDGSLKSSLLKQLKTAFDIDVFIETGTYLGSTTLKAAPIFNEVHTVELSYELYLRAQERLQPWENVIVHFGSSESILLSLLPSVVKRTLFYLDGHYSGNATARSSLDTPILKELGAIENAKKTDSVILIDDIRLFQDSCFPEKIKAWNFGLEAYPDLKEVVRAILKINPYYQICFLGDALLAFPPTPSVCVSPIVRACALHRLESLCTDLLEEDLKEADHTISRAQSREKEQIAIYFETYAPFELEHGYRSYATLWYGLTLREEGSKELATSLLQKAAQNSMPNWRISHCLFFK